MAAPRKEIEISIEATDLLDLAADPLRRAAKLHAA
jgi:hypothetical protein